MRGFNEKDVAAYVDRYMRQNYGRLLDAQYFVGTVVEVGGALGACIVQVQRNGESVPDGATYACSIPGYYPQVGDSVECCWRDNKTAYVLWPRTKASGLYLLEDIVVGTTGSLTNSYLASPAASIAFPKNFNAIPQGLPNLLCVWEARGDTAAQNTDLLCQVNGDTGGTYEWEQQLITGGAASAPAEGVGGQTSMRVGGLSASTAPAGYYSGGRIEVPNYGGTTAIKKFVCQGGLKLGTAPGQQYIVIHAGFWRPSTAAAITSLLLRAAAGNIITGSRFTFYAY